MINILLEIGIEDLPNTQSCVVKKLLMQTVKSLDKNVLPVYNTFLYITHRRFAVLLTNIKIRNNIQNTNDTLHFSFSHDTHMCVLIKTLKKTFNSSFEKIKINVTNKRCKISKQSNNTQKCIAKTLLNNFKELLTSNVVEKKNYLNTTCLQFIRPLLYTTVLINEQKKNNLKPNAVTFINRIITNKTSNILKITTKTYEKKLEKCGLVIPSLIKRLELCRRKISILETKYNSKILNGKKLLTELCMGTEYPNIKVGVLKKKYFVSKSKFLLENIVTSEQNCFLTENLTGIQNVFFLGTNTLHSTNRYKNVLFYNLISMHAKLKDQSTDLNNMMRQIYKKYTNIQKEKQLETTSAVHFTLTYYKEILDKEKKATVYFLLRLLNTTNTLKTIQDNVFHVNTASLYIYKTMLRNKASKNITKTLQNLTLFTNYNARHGTNSCLIVICIHVTTNFKNLITLVNTKNYSTVNNDPFGIRSKVKQYSIIALAHKLNVKKTTKVFKKMCVAHTTNKIPLTTQLTKRILLCKKKEYNTTMYMLKNYVEKVKNINVKLTCKLSEYSKTKKRITNLVKFTQNSYKIKQKNTPKKNLNLIKKSKYITCKIYLFTKQKRYKNTLLELLKLHYIYDTFLETCNVYSNDLLKTKQYVYTLNKNTNILKLIQI